MDSTRQMLVIGAGPIGLAVAKALKHHAIPYAQVEADAGPGGNWRHGVYDTVHIISSRRTTEYADFPMPADYPDFPSRAQLLAYYNDYADHFDLRGAIEFNRKVVHVRPVEADQWEVRFAEGDLRRYKGVIVCNGHHWQRRWANYPGTLNCEFLHAKDYHGPEQLRGKRVLVIGGGNSACDIVSEAARVAASAHLSLRRGYWFLPKTIFGVPSVELIHPWLPVFAQRLLIRALLRIVVGRYEQYGLPRPDHRLFEHHPTVNSELLHYLKHGRITPHPDIRRWVGNTVTFEDGAREEFDLVISATGYQLGFPFLADGLVEVRGPVAQLCAGCMLPDYKHLYIVGTTQVRYGIGPLVTPYADLLCMYIQMQDTFVHPVGAVLQDMGYGPPDTHLVDPHAALRQLRRARLLAPLLLPRRERKLRRRQPRHNNKPLPPPTRVDEALEVF